MNEAGVFGRFIPDFGRVVAQMQFDMYHHYTVDEHSIRAIGLLSRIERGVLKEDHPLATALFQRIASRRALYVAVLLHDIAKGRGGDHSELGAEVALALCPRLGLTDAETETVAWLVRWHLLMSATAFKRDLADPKTIQDFVERVKSLERLRLLFLLTVVDIRAVGPGTWNSWKSQLLRDLVRRRRGDAAARPQAERPQGADRGHPGGARRPARLGREPLRPLHLAAARQLLARRADRGDRAQRPLPRRRRPPTRTATGPCRDAGPAASAAPPWSRSMPRTSPACSTGSPARSASPAATSSTPASTPPTTAWRSTISSSRTSAARPFADPHQLKRLEGRGRCGRWPATSPRPTGSPRAPCR